MLRCSHLPVPTQRGSSAFPHSTPSVVGCTAFDDVSADFRLSSEPSTTISCKMDESAVTGLNPG
jgi:hypothetical protein